MIIKLDKYPEGESQMLLFTFNIPHLIMRSRFPPGLHCDCAVVTEHSAHLPLSSSGLYSATASTNLMQAFWVCSAGVA